MKLLGYSSYLKRPPNLLIKPLKSTRKINPSSPLKRQLLHVNGIMRLAVPAFRRGAMLARSMATYMMAYSYMNPSVSVLGKLKHEGDEA